MKDVKKKPLVFMALSGGVDSAVSAYLLKKQGYEVRAVFMKNWTGTHLNLAGECNWTYERDDAATVAKHLNIPFEVWDFEREYRRDVVDYFFREYARGRTPNPDVRCNQYVKIPLFLNKALKEGADFVATGHYARKNQWLVARNQWQFNLLNGVDPAKDQSYFLYTLNQKQLKHLLFPVGEMSKPEVRALAQKIKLPVAKKPDSVGICFVGEVKVEEFLKTRLPEKPGPIVDTKGNVLGKHKGLHFYTIGQRSGFGLAGGPWYAVGRKWSSNTLIVGKIFEQKLLLAKKCILTRVHFINGVPKEKSFKILATHRYHHPAVPARLIYKNKKWHLVFDKSQRAITPGQSAVFYKKQDVILRSKDRRISSAIKNDKMLRFAQHDNQNLVCLGGGVIDKVENTLLKW